MYCLWKARNRKLHSVVVRTKLVENKNNTVLGFGINQIFAEYLPVWKWWQWKDDRNKNDAIKSMYDD